MKLFWGIVISFVVLLLIGTPVWGCLLIVGVIWLIFYVVSRSTNPADTASKPDNNNELETLEQSTEITEPVKSQYETPTQGEATQLRERIFLEKRTSVSHDISSPENLTGHNDSVIDVTGESCPIQANDFWEQTIFDSVRTDTKETVPYWDREYIYSTDSLDTAGIKIRRFYKKYKEAFLAGTYYDLYGNSNYAFTLMFDFIEEYDKLPNLTRLTDQMRRLAEHYPETQYYAEQHLIERAKKSGKRKAQCAEGEISIDDLIELFPDSRAWSFADRYAEKLNLTDDECELFEYFNSQWDTMYAHFEFMKIKHVELFRNIVKAIDLQYDIDGKSFKQALTETAELFNVKGRNGRYDYNRSIYVYDNMSTADKIKIIYSCIFRHCRNKLYNRYGLHWTIDVFPYDQPSGSKRPITKLLKNIEPIIDSVTEALPNFTDDEEAIINSSFTTRWRAFYQKISESYKGNIQDYLDQVGKLVKQNNKNPGLRHLLFDATKFLVGKDDISALRMYLGYVDAYRKFAEGDEKPLPKYICKKLFKKTEQQEEFENLVRQYKLDNDEGKAYDAIDQLFLCKRKKLSLNIEEISKITEQHSETVQLLNEVMNEEDVNEKTQATQRISDSVETHCNIAASTSKTEILLDSLHWELLDIFVGNHYSLPKSQVENFAKSNGIMANRLVDKINELCYEVLDDVLIDDENDKWTILEDYLKKIVVK